MSDGGSGSLGLGGVFALIGLSNVSVFGRVSVLPMRVPFVGHWFYPVACVLKDAFVHLQDDARFVYGVPELGSALDGVAVVSLPVDAEHGSYPSFPFSGSH